MSKLCLYSTFFVALVITVNISAKPQPGSIDIIVNNQGSAIKPNVKVLGRPSGVKQKKRMMKGKTDLHFPKEGYIQT